MGRAADLGAGLAAVATILLAGGADAAEAATRARSPASPHRLAAFRSCDTLVAFARRNAVRTVGANGVRPRFGGGLANDAVISTPPPTPMPAEGSPASPAPAAAPVRGTPTAGVDYSQTNLQEAGVDEPDIVKTDGSVIYAVSGGKLVAVAAGDEPRKLGSLDLDGYGHQLLLRGDRLLVISTAGLPMPVAPQPRANAASSPTPPAPQRIVTRIIDVDVSDPAAMRAVHTLRVDGSVVSGRQNGATARLVIRSSPRAFDAVVPAGPAATPEVKVRRRNRNRAVVQRLGLSGWVPVALSASTRSKRRILRPLISCRRVLRPMSFSGSGMLTVLTIDMVKGLPAVDSDGLMTDAETVYGSAGRLYVATQKWLAATDPDRDSRELSTAIHEFDISDPGRTRYTASGRVPGYLLNQFSLSEYAGHLRAATTRGPRFGNDTDSVVTVLRSQAGKLVQVGQVSGLGRGERIYAVRFIGDAGFVVTFRQVDPLYTLDLSTPARPRVMGELKIRGYSAYLHPAGGDLLIGVGRDATAEGVARGTQLSLFDVSDLRNPARLAARTIGTFGSSEAEHDHHAFLWWPASKLAVVPVQLYEEGGPGFTGAIGFRVDKAAGIAETGRVTHDAGGWREPVRRSLVIGARLYTLSDRALVVSRLDTLTGSKQLSLTSP